MTNQDIQTQIDGLAEDLVLLDPGDVPALAELHTKFEGLVAGLDSKESPELMQAVTGAMDLVEKIILDDVADVDEIVTVLNETVTALQEAADLPEGVPLPSFPDMLGVSPSDGPSPGDPAQDTPAAAGTPDETSATTDSSSLPPGIDESLYTEFITFQRERLERWEELVLDMEKDDVDQAFPELRRIVHTLKGEAVLLGLEDIEGLCHAVETGFTANDPRKMTEELLLVKDWIAHRLGISDGDGSDIPSLAELLRRAEDPTEDRAASLPPEPEAPAPQDSKDFYATDDEDSAVDDDLVSDFVLEATEHLDAAEANLLEMETSGPRADTVNAIFRAFHTIKGVAGFLNLTELRQISHEAETLLDLIRKKKKAATNDAMQVTFEAVDMLKSLLVEVAASGVGHGDPSSLEALIARLRSEAERTDDDDGPMMIDDDEDPLQGAVQPPVGDPSAPPREVAAGEKGPTSSDTRDRQHAQIKDTIKVDTERLDRLVDAIGELVITELMVHQSVESADNSAPELTRRVGELGKITREIQEMGTSLRMVPVRPTFQKMARLVRDLSRKLSKPIDFIMSGEDTELDKTVVDRIGDPLVHIIRNSLDHGVESVEERRKVGKPDVGRIELSAYHKGGNIHLEIHDDGQGLNRERIRSKAVERGLISESAKLSDREVYGLILEPGFSTAEKVTEVSGRGVGMDVVKRNVEALRGLVDIQSVPGEGTTLTLQLPLTLAIIDGLVVRAGKERYILPTLSVVRMVQPKKADVTSVLDRCEMVSVQGDLLPLLRPHVMFGIDDAVTVPWEALVVVVEEEGRQAGLLVDELVGQQQVVIKSLGEYMSGVQGIAGGAIMPDGHVGLIVDVGGALRTVDTEVIQGRNGGGSSS